MHSLGCRQDAGQWSGCRLWEGPLSIAGSGKVQAVIQAGRLDEFPAYPNGLTITNTTMTIISTVGASFIIRQWPVDLTFRSSANARTAAAK